METIDFYHSRVTIPDCRRRVLPIRSEDREVDEAYAENAESESAIDAN